MTVDFLSSASCNFCSSDRPSIRGMLISDTTMSTCGCCSIDCSASMPSWANMNCTTPSRICLRNFCRTRASRSGSSSTTRMVAVMRLAPGFSIAIGSDHDDGNVGPFRPHFRQHFEPAHAGHVDVGQNQDQGRIPFSGPNQCRGRRRSKLHEEPPGFYVSPELLTKQGFYVGLIVDHEYVNAQFLPPACACAAPVRGSVIMNSVKTPGLVSTSILPPCCFTTMSWLIDRPSPVPSPAGLVVKKGLNIFSFTSSGIPVPLSRIRISTLVPRLFVDALSVGSKLSSPASLRLVAA